VSALAAVSRVAELDTSRAYGSFPETSTGRDDPPGSATIQNHAPAWSRSRFEDDLPGMAPVAAGTVCRLPINRT